MRVNHRLSESGLTHPELRAAVVEILGDGCEYTSRDVADALRQRGKAIPHGKVANTMRDMGAVLTRRLKGDHYIYRMENKI